jgi:MFS family permease
MSLNCPNNVSLSVKAVIGLAAAIILFLSRMIQGLCLGGQYGGAITYVAEHVEDKHRGYYTG